MWTRFMDMHSGGGAKEEWEYIYIEAPFDEAIRVFHAKFNHNPYRITCTCCGSDYSVREYETIEEATKYERMWRTNESQISIADFINQHDVHLIYASEITNDERATEVPEQGWRWVD